MGEHKSNPVALMAKAPIPTTDPTSIFAYEPMSHEPTNGKAPVKVRQIAILGTASPSIRDYPENPASGWELWGMVKAALHRELRKGAGCAIYFEPHARTLWDHKTDVYAKVKEPIYMQQVYPEIPSSREYPLERALTEIPSEIYGRTPSTPFGAHRSTIGYMIAFAILELGPQHHKPKDQRDMIGLWGVEMSAEGEYGYQKPNCEALLGYAMGLGIKVILPDSTTLLRGNSAYGYQPRGAVTGPVNYERMLKDKKDLGEALVRASRGVAGAAALGEWLEAFMDKYFPDKSSPDLKHEVTLKWVWDQIQEYTLQRGELAGTIRNLEGQSHKVDEYLHAIDVFDRNAQPPRT